MNTPGEGSGRGVYLVDTNVFLRFLTNDVPEEADAAEALFRAAEAGRITLYANPLVIAEIVWVLESFYRTPRSQVAEAVRSLIAFPSIIVVDPALLLRAIEVYETDPDGENKKVFSGWMFAESPGLNALEHPVFDIWLTDCANPARSLFAHETNCFRRKGLSWPPHAVVRRQEVRISMPRPCLPIRPSLRSVPGFRLL